MFLYKLNKLNILELLSYHLDYICLSNYLKSKSWGHKNKYYKRHRLLTFAFLYDVSCFLKNLYK